jgi:restriction endonuclease S subunit
LLSLDYGKPLKEENRIAGEYPVYGSNGIVGYHNDYIVKEPFIIVGRKGSAGEVHFSEKSGYPIDTTFYIRLNEENRILLKYAFFILKDLNLSKLNNQAGVPGVNRNDVYNIEIPLPPIDIQQKIVNEIEGYQKIIDGCNLIIKNYKPSFNIDEHWEIVKLAEVCIKITDGSHYSPPTDKEGFAYVTVKDLDNDVIDFVDCDKIEESEYIKLVKADCKPLKNDILFSKDGTVGKVSFVDFDKDFVVLSSLAIIRPNPEMIIPRYLFYVLKSESFLDQALNFKKGVAIRRIILKDIKEIAIPLPANSDQQKIVDRLDKEYDFIKNSNKLKTQMEQKIKEVIDGVWGKSDN